MRWRHWLQFRAPVKVAGRVVVGNADSNQLTDATKSRAAANGSHLSARANDSERSLDDVSSAFGDFAQSEVETASRHQGGSPHPARRTEITDDDYRCVWRPCPALDTEEEATERPEAPPDMPFILVE